MEYEKRKNRKYVSILIGIICILITIILLIWIGIILGNNRYGLSDIMNFVFEKIYNLIIYLSNALLPFYFYIIFISFILLILKILKYFRIKEVKNIDIYKSKIKMKIQLTVTIVLTFSMIYVGVYYRLNEIKFRIGGSLTTDEPFSFNSTWEMYEGQQIGTNIKAMISKLATNYNTYYDDESKQPKLYYPRDSESGSIYIAKNIDEFNQARSEIQARHTYYVKFIFSEKNGYIVNIIVEWDEKNYIKNGIYINNGIYLKEGNFSGLYCNKIINEIPVIGTNIKLYYEENRKNADGRGKGINLVQYKIKQYDKYNVVNLFIDTYSKIGYYKSKNDILNKINMNEDHTYYVTLKYKDEAENEVSEIIITWNKPTEELFKKIKYKRQYYI